MTDKKFTLLELHLHDSSMQFGPSSLRELLSSSETDSLDDEEGTDDSVDVESADESADDDASGGSRLKRFVVMLLLGAAAAAVKYLLQGDDEDSYDLDNVTDLGVVTGERKQTREADREATRIEVEGGDDDDSGRSLTGVVLLLLVVAFVAFVVKQLGGGEDELEALEALDEAAAEP